MNLNFDLINWAAVAVCFVVGQAYLTLWFLVIFGEPWAKAYHPDKTKAEHGKEIPGYTYGIGAICMITLILGIALLQTALQITSLGSGLSLAAFVSLTFVLATTVPGYAFLRRWNALAMAVGSQITLIFILSAILAMWH